MVSPLFFYQLALIALVWLCVMLQWMWPSAPTAVAPTTQEPTPPPPKRNREPKPFEGFITKPHCDACEHASAPPGMMPTRGRRRQVDTSTHFCPNPDAGTGAGWAGAISGPMAIPVAVP